MTFAARLLACLCAAVGFVSFTAAPAAAAGDYVVTGVCRVAGLEGMFGFAHPGLTGIRAEHGCIDGQFGGFVVHALAQPMISGGVDWTLVAPHETKIHSVVVDREFVGWGDQFRWEVTKTASPFGGGVGTPLETVTGAIPPANGPVTFTVDSKAVSASLSCNLATCDGTVPRAMLASVLFKIPVVDLEDEFFPHVQGSTSTSQPVGGVTSVSYRANDGGSGVASVGLIVDGSLLPVVAESNEGKCQTPYQFLVPCDPQVDGSLPLDTTAFSNGAHTVEVVAADAAEQETKSTPFTITIHNSPTNVERPVLSGLAKVGERLFSTSGKWSGGPSAFAYQWLRCPPDVKLGDESGCTAIPGATQPQYTTVAADVAHREVSKVTAENAFGQEAALSAPSEIVTEPGIQILKDTTPPMLSNVSLSRRRFRVGRARTPLARAKLGHGAVLRFSSSEAGTLSVAIMRVRARRRSKTTKVLATLTRTINAGRGRLALSGRIGRKRMAAGRYRLRMTVTDVAGNTSSAAGRSFRILAG